MFKINRSWLADTLALISFTVVTGMFIEVVLVGMTIQQSLFSRLMCQPVNILTGRMYGIYRDHLIAKVCGGNRTYIKESLGDMLAYLTFQLPLYVLILLAAKVDSQTIIAASVSQTLALLALGAPFGQWLKLTRRFLVNVQYKTTKMPV